MIDKVRYTIVAILLTVGISLSAQLPISWSQNLGDANKNIIEDVIDLDGQGCLTIGYTKDASSRDADLWINRFNIAGVLVWSKNFGGSCFEKANAGALLDDGHIVLVGSGHFLDNNAVGASKRSDGAIIKIDQDGNLIWQRTYGGQGEDQFSDVVAIPNGQCLAVGSTSSFQNNLDNQETNGWAVQVNSNGGAIWNRRFGGELMDRYTSVIRNQDGSFLLGGTSNSRDGDSPNSFGAEDIWISKLTANGVLDWSRNYGGNEVDLLAAIAPSQDGTYVLAGTTYSNLSNHKGHGDIFVLKVSALGNPIWQKLFGGTATEKSTDIFPFQDGGFLLASTTMSNDGDISTSLGGQDAWLTKLNDNGDVEWKQTLGGSKNDALYASAISDDGTIWLAGYSFSSDNNLTSNMGNQDGWLLQSSTIIFPTLSLGDSQDLCVGTDVILDGSNANCTGCIYLWNDGVTNPVRTVQVINSTVYSVTITDNTGVTTTDNISITAIDPINSVANLSQVTCHNAADGAINLTTTGGTGDYDYAWSNTPQNISTNNNLAANTYFVTISDNALCTFTDAYILDNPSPLVVTADITEPACTGSNNGGEISLNISGGEPPYEVNWDNGFIGPEITGLQPGQYIASVTDSRGCQYIEAYFLSNDVNININSTIDHVSCNGLADGAITLSISGDFPPFSAMWDNGFASNSIIGLAPGDYTVTVTDAMDCQLIAAYTITQPNELQVFEDQVNTQDGQATGRLLLNISGGTPSYNVQWSNGETGVLIQNLATGVYSATITDANDCALIVSYEIMIGTSSTQVIQDALEIFPNPNNGTFTVQLPEGISSAMTTKLMRIDGKEAEIGIHNMNGDQLTLMVKRPSDAMYILVLQDDQDIYQSKLIIHQ